MRAKIEKYPLKAKNEKASSVRLKAFGLYPRPNLIRTAY